MSIKSYFFNAVKSGGVYDRIYNAQDVTDYLDLLVGNGVFPNPSTNLQVMAGTGMDITVKTGAGWIDGHKIVNNADLVLTVSAADVLLDRIDRVIFYVDHSDREMGIEILEGTAASEPEAPALTRTSLRSEYCLAEISVTHQTAAIDQTMITDTRADSEVCGWVQGLIDQVDTSTLFLQWQAAYQQYYAEVYEQLTEFMETLTQELRVNTYMVEYSKNVSLAYGDSRTIALDMNAYSYEGTDTFLVTINGLAAVEGTDYTIDGDNETITLTLTGTEGMTEDIGIKVLKSVVGIAALADSDLNQIVTSGGDSLYT